MNQLRSFVLTLSSYIRQLTYRGAGTLACRVGTHADADFAHLQGLGEMDVRSATT